MRREKGITLVAIVVTIIVLLVLSGIMVSLLLGDNGIITRTQIAKEEYRGASVKEEIDLWKAEIQMAIVIDSYGESLENLLGRLKTRGLLSDNEIDVIKTDQEIRIGKFTINVRVPAQIRADGTWDGKVNSPKLVSGMQAIYWDESGNEVKQDDEKFDVEKWYDYENKKWANAITNDGSYWVWIPRFVYKITEQPAQTSGTGKIEIQFIDNNNENNGIQYSTTYPAIDLSRNMLDYYVHPAFTTDLELGGWSEDTSGFWMSKYVVGREDSTNGGVTWQSIDTDDGGWRDQNAIGNVLLEKNKIRLSSKPGLYGWVGTTVGTAYKNAYDYDRTKESHLQKNSEWGAMAYLAYSSYGLNKQQPVKNATEYLTGGGTGDAYKSNLNQTTTGNITGVYDTVFGEQLVALYNSITDEGTDNYIHECYSKDGFIFMDDPAVSTKYATVYTNGEEMSWGFGLETGKYGDGIKETFVFEEYHWNNQEMWLIYNGITFLSRGTDGIFGAVGQFGFTSPYMLYRVCLTP